MIRNEFAPILETPNRCRTQSTESKEDSFKDERRMIQLSFWKCKANQLIDFQIHFERECNTVPVFGINNAKYDRNLIKVSLIPIHVTKRKKQSTVKKMTNQLVSFAFGNVQLLHVVTFFGGATNHGSFLKAHKRVKKKLLLLWMAQPHPLTEKREKLLLKIFPKNYEIATLIKMFELRIINLCLQELSPLNITNFTTSTRTDSTVQTIEK